MAHSNVKLPEAAVQEMIRLRREGHWSHAKIAHEFQCSKATVQKYLAPYEAEAATNGPVADAAPAVPALEDVPLEAIHLEGDTTARVAINGHIVNEYAEAMAEREQFPPVILFRDAEGYWIADGHHRCRAAQQVGFLTIRAEVQEGGPREAFLHAVGANATHGNRRGDLDKRHVVNRLLMDEEWGQWSDREIARRCKVSHPFVAKLRAELAERRARLSGNDYQMPETRTVQRGESTYTMDTTGIGTRSATTAPMNGAPEAVEEPVTFAPDELARWQAAYPEFVHPGITSDDFRIIAQGLDAMTPEERQERRARWKQGDLNAIADLLGEPPIPPSTPEQRAGRQAADGWSKFFYHLSVLASSVKKDWPALMQSWPLHSKQSALKRAREWQTTVSAWVTALEQEIPQEEPAADA